VRGHGQAATTTSWGQVTFEQRVVLTPVHRLPRHALLVTSSSLNADLWLGAGMRIAKVARRVWIPLVVLVVIVCGGFIVSRVHGLFGTERRPSYVGGQVDGATSFNPTQMIYEVFGPPGTVADINYFDVNSEPQQIDGTPLPWSFKITTTSQSVVGSVVAQGNSDSIGCRIVVGDQVRAERISDGVNAYTHCLVTDG
jgi:hypothetical protein